MRALAEFLQAKSSLGSEHHSTTCHAYLGSPMTEFLQADWACALAGTPRLICTEACALTCSSTHQVMEGNLATKQCWMAGGWISCKAETA
jgi:hypothetical protein